VHAAHLGGRAVTARLAEGEAETDGERERQPGYGQVIPPSPTPPSAIDAPATVSA
jgi:hypothetical protein